MASISTNEFKNGLKLIVEGDPCEILEHEFHKPGKGQAVMREIQKFKSMECGKKHTKLGSRLKRLILRIYPCNFCTKAAKVVMMNNNSFDQETFSKSDLGDSIQWMEEGGLMKSYYLKVRLYLLS